MTFIEHSLNWVKGELFEANLLALWGAMIVVLATFFWKFGHTATAKSLVIPFMVVGLFWGLAGGISLYVNTHRIDKYTMEYEKEPHEFVVSERKRVDGFIWVYRYLLITWSIMILMGLAFFMIWGGNHGRAIGLGFILFGISGLLVDHTSEQNAHAYDVAINKELESVGP